MTAKLNVNISGAIDVDNIKNLGNVLNMYI